MAGLNCAEALVGIDQKNAAIETAQRALGALRKIESEISGNGNGNGFNKGPGEKETGRPGKASIIPESSLSPGIASIRQSAHFPPGFDLFRVEWERAAWQHAGQSNAEAFAKLKLIRWRLHLLLGELTGDVHHYFEAVIARPDLSPSQAALGCALGRSGRFADAVDHLRHAVGGHPEAVERLEAWIDTARIGSRVIDTDLPVFEVMADEEKLSELLLRPFIESSLPVLAFRVLPKPVRLVTV